MSSIALLLARRAREKHPTPGDVIVVIGITALNGLAIREQLHLPPDERTWLGTLFGIPYDFRRPTIERLRETFWNKDTARVLVPQFFGMGWLPAPKSPFEDAVEGPNANEEEQRPTDVDCYGCGVLRVVEDIGGGRGHNMAYDDHRAGLSPKIRA